MSDSIIITENDIMNLSPEMLKELDEILGIKEEKEIDFFNKNKECMIVEKKYENKINNNCIIS